VLWTPADPVLALGLALVDRKGSKVLEPRTENEVNAISAFCARPLNWALDAWSVDGLSSSCRPHCKDGTSVVTERVMRRE
jgi:hypothetical protein